MLTLKSITRFKIRSILTVVAFAFILFPGQMLVAAVLSLWLRGNLPIACGLVWLTNPLTSPPILYLALKIGSWFMPLGVDINLGLLLNYEWLHQNLQDDAAGFLKLLQEAWQPLLLGTFMIGTVMSVSSYLAVHGFWRWHVMRAWNARQLRRLQLPAR